MFFELRTYDLKPGKAPIYLELFRTYGLSRVTQHLPMMGYWLVESGRLNRIEHMWAYESWDEREACRAGLVGNAEWMGEFVPKAFVDVVAQANRFLQLDETSDSFDQAIGARKTRHLDQPSGTPMFAGSLQRLTIGADVAGGEAIATFTVLSGNGPGDRVTLTSGSFDALCCPTPNTHTHEILRPLSCSPLQ